MMLDDRALSTEASQITLISVTSAMKRWRCKPQVWALGTRVDRITAWARAVDGDGPVRPRPGTARARGAFHSITGGRRRALLLG